MRRLTTTLLAVAAVGAACAEPVSVEGARCSPLHRCPAGYACQAGACRGLGGGGATGCADDGDCALGVCHEGAGFCVQCVEDTDCARGVCLEGQFQCGCEDGDDCAVTRRCAKLEGAKAGYCAPCYAQEQCAAGATCDVARGVCEEKVRRGAGRSGREARGR